ncbi:MAG: hypothetical protein ACRC1X_09190 [Lactobacillus panisapium]
MEKHLIAESLEEAKSLAKDLAGKVSSSEAVEVRFFNDCYSFQVVNSNSIRIDNPVLHKEFENKEEAIATFSMIVDMLAYFSNHASFNQFCPGSYEIFVF